MSEQKIDYNRGMVSQVYHMPHDFYIQWVHKPLKDIESIRMFDSDFWERLSFTYYFAIPGIWWPIIIIALSFMFYWYSIIWITLWFIIGFVSWFPTEHIIHRVIFHMDPWTPFMQRAHFMFHAVHHLTPKDPYRLVMPPFVTINIVLILFPISVFLLDFSRAIPWWCGFGFMYTIYDLTHYSLHHNFTQVFTFLGGDKTYIGKTYRQIYLNHMAHHFNDHKSNFGVTNVSVDHFMKTKHTTNENTNVHDN